jgi:uncharacterized protein YoxC
MKDFWKYISTFLAGAIIILLIAFRWVLNKVNVTNADTVIESLEQSIKKLKQDGQGNITNLTNTVNTDQETKTKKQLRKEKRAVKPIHRFYGFNSSLVRL